MPSVIEEIKQNIKEGRKDDAEKLDWTLLPWEEVEEVVKVLAHGAKKYGAENWRFVEQPRKRYRAALMRHMVEYEKGYIKDAESGLEHMAHIICCALFIMHFNKKGPSND